MTSKIFSWPATIPSFSERWDWSRAKTYQLIAAGNLGSIKIGGSRRILQKHEQAMIEALLADQEEA